MIYHNKKFMFTTIAAGMILAGVITKNTYEQLGESNEISEYAGPGLFVLGWAGLAYALSMTPEGALAFNKRTWIFFGCAAGIVASVMMMKEKMKNDEDVPMYLPAIFSVCWLLLGFSMTNSVLGLTAAALVLTSMLWTLPWQRKNGIVDGPGMPMFVIAWIIIIYANSHSGSMKLPAIIENLKAQITQ